MNRRARTSIVAAFLVVVGAAGVGVAIERVDDAATVAMPASRHDPGLGDVVAIFDVETVDRPVVEATFRAAERAGAAAAAARTGSLGMLRIARGGATVHRAPDGFLIPMVYLALPHAAIGGLVGTDVSSIIDRDSVVINELTARQTGALVGDVIDLRATDGSTRSFEVVGIRPYDQVGGSELVMSIEGADRLGMFDDTRTVIWGIESRSEMNAALAAEGLEARPDTQVLRSWAEPEPDDTLSTARVKQLLGEPWYRVRSDGSLEMHPTWKANNLTDGRVLLNASVPVRAQCHLAIVDDLAAALADVAAAGLGGAIDVGNTNSYGGCYNPRYSRTSGFLSRHAYAVAIDMNTVSNCLGCTPRMDCRVVHIFREHGFAWGGNFRRADGMHFEWVGEPRHRIPFASRFCPNVAGAASRPAGQVDGPVVRGRDVLVDGVDAPSHGDHDHTS